jgi:hypothetical protein
MAVAAVLTGGTAAPLATAPAARAALAPSAFAWGDNEFGQVGNESKATPEWDSPLSVILPAAVRQVSASMATVSTTPTEGNARPIKGSGATVDTGRSPRT